MQVCFRIREIKNQAGEIVFVPERLYILSVFAYSPAGQKRPEEKWDNITQGFGCAWYATFDSAKDRIKEYVNQHNISKPVDVEIIHLMPEFNYIAEDPKPIESICRFTHVFEGLNTILQYCKKAGITDKFLIEGLENSMEKGWFITKRTGGGYCG